MRLTDHSGAISDFIARNGEPMVTSLDNETHLFHFHETDWRQSPVIFVNRNGNQMRMIRNSIGKYELYKHWSAVAEAQNYEVTNSPKFEDPEKTLNLITVGPCRGFMERLALLPKGIARGKRIAVWRGNMLRASFSGNGGNSIKFSLTGGVSEPSGITLHSSPQFTEKLWESEPAAQWCRSTFPDAIKIETPGRELDPYVREAQTEQMMGELEENPLWGAF